MTQQSRPSHLVVIGSSAGGIEALSQVVATLPADFRAAVVIAQHLDPNQPSHLEEILARRGKLPVRTVTTHGPLTAGEICVIPSNQDVVITDHTVSLRPASSRSTPSIDLLFRSAADAFGERLIAVVLTGTGSDGALGARTVHEAGGAVVVQNPETAAFPGMPRSLSPSTIDVVAELDDVGPLLHALVTGTYSPHQPPDEEEFRGLIDGLRQRRNLDLNGYRRPTILRRLQRRMFATGTETLADYRGYLRDHPEEEDRLVGSLLIKVTDFFRDPAAFDYLRDRVLPGLIAEARERREELRLWSAGCATGEEAYSLAITVSGLLDGASSDDEAPVPVRIFATDLDSPSVHFARRGVYPERALANVPPELLERYFTRVDGEYEVKKEVRDRIVFGEHDLSGRPPFPRTDLVLCRNVLIYFTADLQKRTLQAFAFSLREGGCLVLGSAESARPLAEAFDTEAARLRIFRRNAAPVAPVGLPRSAAVQPAAPTPLRLAAGQSRDVLSGASHQANEVDDLIQRLPVGIVVVNRRYDIQQINGSARRLLGIHGLAVGEDLIHLVESISTDDLRAAIDEAFTDEAPASLEEVATAEMGMGERRYLHVTCLPRTALSSSQRAPTVIIAVFDVSPMVHRRLEVEASEREVRAELERLTGLMTKLGETNERLLAANDELAGQEEALRTTNEEYAAAVAEAQATSEELEAYSEELQASNEELETLNEEVRATVEELNLSNADLDVRARELAEQRAVIEESRAQLAAILEGMSDAVAVVDASGQLVRTNPAYDALIESVGGRLQPLDERVEPLPPDQTPFARAQRGEGFNTDFILMDQDGQRRWFEATGQPFKSGGVNGGLLILREITEHRARALQQQFVSVASHELRTPLTSLNGYLQRHLRLLRRQDGGDDLIESASAAFDQSKRLARLIDELLDLGRIERGALDLRLEPVDLGAVTARAIAVARGLDERHEIRLDDSNGDPLLLVHGDADRLDNVVINLLTNAIKHSLDGSPIEVRLSATDGWAAIEVRDRGEGISAADLPQLFTRFYRVAGQSGSGGLGLGLYVSRETVTAHGGEITVDSQEGHGATFVVRLPLLKAGEDEGDGRHP